MPRADTSAPHAEPDNQQQQQHRHRGNSPPPHLEYTVTCLWVLTPLTATLSLVIVCVAMTTNQWLHTEEKMNNPGYNGTGEKDYLSKNTVSGLWTLCYSNPGEKSLQCYNIDYFPREEYSPDPNDSTMAIPYAVTKSAVFFFLATLFLFVGEFCCLFGHFARHRRLFTFISGLICIISGLLMLIGLVMYISIFKAEIGNKLRPLSQLQPPLFTYRYGFSFLLVVSGFMASEIAGTCAIFLYIYWHQLEWGRKRHEAHLHRRKMSASSMLLDHHHLQQQQPPPGMLYPCRRHPQQPPPNILRPFAYTSPNLQRRFYLERGETTGSHRGSREASPCPGRSDHPIPAVAGSLRDISVSSSYYSFPAPSSGPYQHQQHHYYHHHGGGGDEENACTPPPLDLHPGHPHSHLSGSRSSFFPRDATTNTVSTTADINSCEGGDSNDAAEGVDDEEEEYSPSLQHENEFVTFDLDEQHHHHQQHHHQHHPYPVVPPMPSIRSAPTAPPPPEELPYRRKDYGYDTLRRTTPV